MKRNRNKISSTIAPRECRMAREQMLPGIPAKLTRKTEVNSLGEAIPLDWAVFLMSSAETKDQRRVRRRKRNE